MIFIFGPLYSGKRAAAMQILGCGGEELKARCVWNAQELAARRDDLEELADELARYDAVIATEVGSGVVPADAAQRAARERAGRLSCLLAERAEAVVRVLCGIPKVLRGELP